MNTEYVAHVEVTHLDDIKRIQTGRAVQKEDGSVWHYMMSGTFLNGKWVVDPRVTCRELSSKEYNKLRRERKNK